MIVIYCCDILFFSLLQGYVGVAKSLNALIIAFRGTQENRWWIERFIRVKIFIYMDYFFIIRQIASFFLWYQTLAFRNWEYGKYFFNLKYHYTWVMHWFIFVVYDDTSEIPNRIFCQRWTMPMKITLLKFCFFEPVRAFYFMKLSNHIICWLGLDK